MAMPVILKEVFPVLTSMMAAAVLLVPIVCGTKLTWVGSSARKGPLTPVPLRGMTSGLTLAPSVTVMEPVSRAAAAGVKATDAAQLAPGARLAPQVLVWLKLALAARLAMSKLTLLGLLMVMVWAALVVPTPWEPKLSEAGETAPKAALSITVTAGGPPPAPVPAATSGDPSWLKSATAMRLPDRKLNMGC